MTHKWIANTTAHTHTDVEQFDDQCYACRYVSVQVMIGGQFGIGSGFREIEGYADVLIWGRHSGTFYISGSVTRGQDNSWAAMSRWDGYQGSEMRTPRFSTLRALVQYIEAHVEPTIRLKP